MATRRLALIPRDGLFCKDGRGWHTSASRRGHALDWPWPSTVLGAVRSAWGRREEERTGTLFDRSAWRTRTADITLGGTLLLRRSLLETSWTRADRVWPVPSDALWLEERAEVFRLIPVPPSLPTLGRDDEDTREALWIPRIEEPAKPLRSPRWWSEELFGAWLAGRSVPARAPGHMFETSRRIQVHVGIRPEERTAVEGALFSHDVVETLDPDAEWAIGIEVVLAAGGTAAVATLGADGRLLRIEEVPDQSFDLPDAVVEAFRAGSTGLRLVVTSPACFGRGWLPDGLDPRDGEYRGRLDALDVEMVLRAAIVPRPLHVSGWDMVAGKPKPTSRMVPPGAVYFLERVDGQPFREAEARVLWLAALGARTDEGFGRVVPGTWNPRRG